MGMQHLISFSFYFLRCSHCWFATLHEVLLADWHEVWHSPHPPVFADLARSLDTKVLILFTESPTFLCSYYVIIPEYLTMVFHDCKGSLVITFNS